MNDRQRRLYEEARQVDEWPTREESDGAYIRAGMDALNKEVLMQQAIWKFPLEPDRQGVCTPSMPAEAKVIHVAMQNGLVTLWAIVDPDAAREQRRFHLVGTGWPHDFSNYTYLGTVHDDGFVWHLFDTNGPFYQEAS